MTIFAKILLRRDTAGNLGPIVNPAGCPFYFTDTGEFGVGDGINTNAALVGGLAAYEALALAAAGTDDIAMPARARLYVADVSVAAGTGAYAAKLVLPGTNRRAGDRAIFSVALPASANPTVTLHDGAGTNPALATLAPSATARTVELHGHFDGGAWVLTGPAFDPETVTVTAARVSDATADARALLTAANYAAMRALLASAPALQALPGGATTAYSGASFVLETSGGDVLDVAGITAPFGFFGFTINGLDIKDGATTICSPSAGSAFMYFDIDGYTRGAAEFAATLIP